MNIKGFSDIALPFFVICYHYVSGFTTLWDRVRLLFYVLSWFCHSCPKDFFKTRSQSLNMLTLDMTWQDINIRLVQDMLV